MNVVDSSGWLEYFADSGNADFFTEAIEDTENLVVPTLSMYEVFKRVCQQRGEGEALHAVALMQQGATVELTVSLAVSAARLGLRERLPLADSVILATAHAFDATLWTQDSDFAAIAGVAYTPKLSG